MVKRCAWGTCKTNSRYPERLIKDGKVINFHLFPSEKKFKERRELWIRSCNRADDFKCTKDSRKNGPTDIDPNPVPGFQLQLVEKRFVIHVYTVRLHITFYLVI